MTPSNTVLLLGGTGRTGGRVLTQCIQRGMRVRAVVRSADRLPAGVVDDPLVDVVETDPLTLTSSEWRRHLEGCGAIISCLGHRANPRDVLGPPFDVVARPVSHLSRAAESMQPKEPIRFILMSSVSVNRPAKTDTRRGTGERAFLAAVRGLMPPARDNQVAADFLARSIGPRNRSIEWVVVRPDTLREGGDCEYQLADELVSSIFRPRDTNMACVARFMCDLASDDAQWQRWRGGMPVIVNSTAPEPAPGQSVGDGTVDDGVARS